MTGLILTISFVKKSADPLVEEIRAVLTTRALNPPSPESLAALRRDSLESGLRSIDPYARYVAPTEPVGVSTGSASLGVEIFAYNSGFWIRPDPGGPADRAGIPEIGELKAIDGEGALGNDLLKISALLDKAALKNEVILRVAGRSEVKGKAYRVKPVVYQPSTVTWRRSGTDVVMSINEFVAHNTTPALLARFDVLVQTGTRVVLDLRGCSGGDLFEAIQIAGMFVRDGLPLAKTYDPSGNVKTYWSPPGRKLPSPLMILIDDRTASAAEVLAGILQYHHVSSIVGERSYGKCVSQTLVPLSDGGGLWLTNLEIQFPDNTSCRGSGIKPDIFYQGISTDTVSDIISRAANGSLKLHLLGG